MHCVFLANGFEEIEAIAPIDILRRAGLEITTIGVGGRHVEGAHGIVICADMEESSLNVSDIESVILPGGMPGTLHLEQSVCVQNAIAHAVSNSLPVAAICAAPSILGHGGYLSGIRATCYPGFEAELQGAIIQDTDVVTDGLFTTARGAGVAVDFALELVRRLVNEPTATHLKEAIQCR